VVTEAHKDAICSLKNRLCGVDEDDQDQDDEDVEHFKKPHKRRRFDTGALCGPNDPWKKITVLEKMPELPSFIRNYLKEHDTDPTTFLDTEGPQAANKFARYSLAQTGDILLAHYTWMEGLDAAKVENCVKLNICDMFFFRLMRLLRPGASGRVGPVLASNIREFLEPIAKGAGRDVGTMTADLDKRCIRGARLEKVCKKWTRGCIFYLSFVLTQEL
jgi:hypothetical protein